MNTEYSASADHAAAALIAAPGFSDEISAPRAVFHVECLDPDGAVKWIEEVHNTVFTAGKLDLLNVYFGATAKPAAWYLVLKGTGTEVPADTLASHASWPEQSGLYTSTSRQTVSFSAATASGNNGQIATSAAVAVAITTAGTIAGCGLCQTVAKGTLTGIMYNAGDFASSRTVGVGDTINVTLTLTIT